MSVELVRNCVTPLGGRHLCRLVVYTQNSSSIKCTLLSGRFGQIGYHYKLQDSAKMCLSTKMPSASGELCPLTPTGGCAPRPPYTLVLPLHRSPAFCSPNVKLLPTPLCVWPQNLEPTVHGSLITRTNVVFVEAPVPALD